jgi:AraC family transcriptional regulator
VRYVNIIQVTRPVSLSAKPRDEGWEQQPPRLRLSFAWGTAEILPATPYSVRYHSAGHTVGLTLERQVGVHAFASDRREAFDAWANTLAFTPCNMDVFSESSRGGEYLLLHVDPSTFAGVLEDYGSGSGIAFRRVMRAAHEPAGLLARRVRKNLLAGASALETEPLLLDLVALAAEMVAECGRGRGRQRTPGTERRRVADVIDFVEAHLEEPLSLARLAGLIGLTPLRLLRAFRSHLGTTPHAYVRERRAARARALLAGTNLSIAEVALCCGFSSQAHLTSTMRQLLDCTPGTLRSSERLLRQHSA